MGDNSSPVIPDPEYLASESATIFRYPGVTKNGFHDVHLDRAVMRALNALKQRYSDKGNSQVFESFLKDRGCLNALVREAFQLMGWL